MTDEQTERLIAALERIAAALEATNVAEALKPVNYRYTVIGVKPEDVQTKTITSRPIRHMWPQTTAGEGLLSAQPVQELSGVWHTPVPPDARVIFR